MPKVSYHVSPDVLDDYNKWRKQQGLEPVSMPVPKKQYYLYISVKAYDHLCELAGAYGFIKQRLGNTTIDMSGFIEAIGNGDILLK